MWALTPCNYLQTPIPDQKEWDTRNERETPAALYSKGHASIRASNFSGVKPQGNTWKVTSKWDKSLTRFPVTNFLLSRCFRLWQSPLLLQHQTLSFHLLFHASFSPTCLSPGSHLLTPLLSIGWDFSWLPLSELLATPLFCNVVFNIERIHIKCNSQKKFWLLFYMKVQNFYYIQWIPDALCVRWDGKWAREWERIPVCGLCAMHRLIEHESSVR